MTDQTLTKAQIASKAQAAAHRELRERYPDDYRGAYQQEKERLTAAESKS